MPNKWRIRGSVATVGIFLFAGAASAASQQDRADCASQDPTRAIAACSRIIPDQDESVHNRAGAYVLRAGAYLSQGNTDRAMADYGEAIQLAPRNVVAYVRRAAAYFHNGDKDHAILDYGIAERLDPIGVAQVAAGNPDIEAVAAAARASPPSPAALDLIIGQLAATGPPSAAAEPAPPPPPPLALPPPPPPPPSKPWNSVAAAIWKVDGRVRVAVGYSGTRSSEREARASAEEACRNAGGHDCQVKGAWNFGCVYITTGNTQNRAGWGSGATTAEATRKCKEQGLACKQPIGGCVE
jgi:tetratricopeptide (TPR) repeat protein